ncbi:MAG: hypothetical protein IJO99_03830 [Ruminococcus sp.]|nr:hypothetical protein [Ruminococcus sp.]
MIDVFDYDIGQSVVVTTFDGNEIIGQVADITTAIDNDSDYDAISIRISHRYLVEIEANKIDSIKVMDKNRP